VGLPRHEFSHVTRIFSPISCSALQHQQTNKQSNKEALKPTITHQQNLFLQVLLKSLDMQ
jgi:hypothetical protein